MLVVPCQNPLSLASALTIPTPPPPLLMPNAHSCPSCGWLLANESCLPWEVPNPPIPQPVTG